MTWRLPRPADPRPTMEVLRQLAKLREEMRAAGITVRLLMADMAGEEAERHADENGQG